MCIYFKFITLVKFIQELHQLKNTLEMHKKDLEKLKSATHVCNVKLFKLSKKYEGYFLLSSLSMKFMRFI